jgi:hypothetical protein
MSALTRIFIMAIIAILAACGSPRDISVTEPARVSNDLVKQTIEELVQMHGQNHQARIEKGVAQAAALWNEADGTADDFKAFCTENFAGDTEAREAMFTSLSRNFEAIWGFNNQMLVELNRALHLDWGPLQSVDLLFAEYAPTAHLTDDLFKNKIAFITILNFPFYSLQEKNERAQNWSRLDWAYARMGDVFISRMPASIGQQISAISTRSDSYISEYNIRMDQLLDNEGNTLFPQGMSLITHWGLRDEIKSNYALEDGLPKQDMIYQVMQRIINQDIPQVVINNPQVQWNPYENKVLSNGQQTSWEREPDTRYLQLLNNFKAHQAADAYNPNYPTYIQRAFDQGLELSQQEVEALFTQLVSSPILKDVGALISKRLGRPLRPYDIWYDGFKARSSISAEFLDGITRQRYPDAQAFEADLPNILQRLGYEGDRAQYLASKIVVEGSRGAGHAWGAAMRSQKSRLRTRIPETGMDYKGYNIAIHEFGHNVEQTVTLYDVDHYMMNGVPNTAFTEAMAFMYQARDLRLLGINNNDPMVEYLNVLDKIWSVYEIMGVSLVDMAVWKWLYANPDATPEQLRNETVRIAQFVWNKYYAPVFGMENQPILAIYSHMISYPLYLSAYPLGHLIMFQIEQQIKGKNLASETDRMLMAGRLTPQEWMRQAVGQSISIQPMLTAAEEAVKRFED